jgi:hypothetical protein
MKARLEFMLRIEGDCEFDVSVVASHFYEFSVSDFDSLSVSPLHAILTDRGLVLRNEDSLFEVLHRLASRDLSYFGLLEFVRFEFLSDGVMKRACEFMSDSFDSLTLGIWSSLQTRLALSVNPPPTAGRFFLPSLDSMIVSEFPEIFTRFGRKTSRLLYRGSRDGLEATNFHARCNGHPHTVTLILSTGGWIFGGYTPVAWNSRNKYVPDPTLQSFVFTIKNPHNLSARIFTQKQADMAVYHDARRGPVFGYNGYDLKLYGDWRKGDQCYSRLGNNYNNDTGIAGNKVLTGSEYFAVQEIEVFELV